VNDHPYALTGRRVLICGATGGIGRACASLAVRLGAEVLLTGRQPAALENLAAELRLVGGGVQTAVLDLLNQSSLEQVASVAPELDGVVNAAAVSLIRPFRLLDPACWRQVVEINLTGPAELCRQLLRHRRLRSGAAIVLVASIAGSLGAPGYVAYSASKAALGGLVRSLAVELAPVSIRVNSVSPGLVASPMSARMAVALTDEQMQRYAAEYPLGLGCPEDVAGLVGYLLSPASRWVTGQDWTIDGGVSVK
jgi:NAD(P)-dependent dehydrogenase (short-subunit alcohol dehydrogenase family)